MVELVPTEEHTCTIVLCRHLQHKTNQTPNKKKEYCPPSYRGTVIVYEADLIDIPRTSMDYYLSSVKDEEAKKNQVIGMTDGKIGETYARSTEEKGAGQAG